MSEETSQADGPETPPGPPTPEPPTVAPPGWRSGLRDLARGLEAGFWFSALFTLVACGFMFGVSMGATWAAGLSWSAVGFFKFAMLWAAIISGCALVVSIPIGVSIWLARGIGARLGREGATAALRRRRRRRRWIVVAALGSFGILAGLGAGGYLGRLAVRNMEEAIAETDALDPYWRIDDVMATRVGVPDEENSALVVAEAQDLTPKDWPGRSTSAKSDDVGPPSPPDAAAVLERMVGLDDSIRMDDASAEALRAELTDLDEAVGIAHELADYDWGRNELELGPTLIDTPLPHAEEARTVARLLRADAFLSVHDGEPDEAVNACLAIFGVARSIGDEPFAISQLVRLAIDAAALQTTRRVLAQDEPSDEWLAALQDLILDERDQPRAWYGFRGERAVLAELIRRFGDGELVANLEGKWKVVEDPSGRSHVVNPLVYLKSAYEMSVALRWCNELLAIFDRPEAEWSRRIEALEAKLVAARGSRIAMQTSRFPIFMMPAFSSFASAELRMRAELGATALLIAAERQRQETGAWPGSIDDIDEAILPEAPLDPYSGEAYRMQYRDGRLRIYSVGPNLRDEGGAYDLKKWGKAAVDDDAGAVGYDPELRGRPAEDADDQP